MGVWASQQYAKINMKKALKYYERNTLTFVKFVNNTLLLTNMKFAVKMAKVIHKSEFQEYAKDMITLLTSFLGHPNAKDLYSLMVSFILHIYDGKRID